MINQNIKYLRKEKNLSQEELSERIGVSRQTIAKWENGESIPDVLLSSKLADIFGVSLDDLVHYKKNDMQSLPLPPKGKYMFGQVTVGERGQIVIPAKARKIFDIKTGDELIVLGDIEQGLALMKSHYLLELINSIKEKTELEKYKDRE